MKKVLSLVLALVMVLAAVSALADNVIKIGVFEPASGDNGAGGKQETLGIQYANELQPTVTVGGTEYTVELVIEDNQSSSDKAVSAAQALVNANVSVVLGSYGSGVSMAGGNVFAEAEIPAIGISCTNPSVTLLCDYYWRICFLDPFQGKVMASFAQDLGAKKAYVLTQLGDDYSTGLGYYFDEAFRALGNETVQETFPEGTSDFTSYLNNAMSAGCDFFFAPSSTTSASLIINQAASMNVTFPLTAGDTWDNSVILQAAQGKNVQVYLSTFTHPDASEEAAAFMPGFKAWLNANPDKLVMNGDNDIVSSVSALGFDAYNTAIAAIIAADSIDPADIAEALPGVTLNGVTGAIAFDENGDANKDSAYIIGADSTGEFVLIKLQSLYDLQ